MLADLKPGHFYRLANGKTPLIVLWTNAQDVVSRYLNRHMGSVYSDIEGLVRTVRHDAECKPVVVLDVEEPMIFRERKHAEHH